MSDSDGSAASSGWILFFILLFINMILFCYHSAIQNNNYEEDENNSFFNIHAQSFKFINAFQLLSTSINIIFGSVFLGNCLRR